MKLARKGVSRAFATVGAPYGKIAAHIFVDDSSAPICQPHAAGTPGALLDYHGAHWCRTCWDRLQRATWSVTSYEKRFLWAVARTRDIADAAHAESFSSFPSAYERHDAWGLASTELEAFKLATDKIAALFEADEPVEIVRVGEAAAQRVAREQRAEARANKISDGTDAQVVEYVYRHHKRFTSWFSSTFEWETERFKVLRKTPKRLFIENTTKTYKTATGTTVLTTNALDRAKLERGKHPYGYTLNPAPPFDPATGKAAIPGWAEVLGLSIPCTLADAKRAFRMKAKAAHPDHGGSPEAFRRVKDAFDAATRQLGGAS